MSTIYFCQDFCPCYVNPNNTDLASALSSHNFNNVTNDSTAATKYQDCAKQDKAQ